MAIYNDSEARVFEQGVNTFEVKSLPAALDLLDECHERSVCLQFRIQGTTLQVRAVNVQVSGYCTNWIDVTTVADLGLELIDLATPSE